MCGRTEVQLATGWQRVIIGITDHHWEKHAQGRVSTYGANLYVSAIALPALPMVASILEEDDFEVPEDR